VRRRSDRPYDPAAATFDRRRKLPEGVAQVLRALDLMRPKRWREGWGAGSPAGRSASWC
jgi:hypothetical protein